MRNHAPVKHIELGSNVAVRFGGVFRFGGDIGVGHGGSEAYVVSEVVDLGVVADNAIHQVLLIKLGCVSVVGNVDDVVSHTVPVERGGHIVGADALEAFIGVVGQTAVGLSDVLVYQFVAGGLEEGHVAVAGLRVAAVGCYAGIADLPSGSLFGGGEHSAGVVFLEGHAEGFRSEVHSAPEHQLSGLLNVNLNVFRSDGDGVEVNADKEFRCIAAGKVDVAAIRVYAVIVVAFKEGVRGVGEEVLAIGEGVFRGGEVIGEELLDFVKAISTITVRKPYKNRAKAQ